MHSLTAYYGMDYLASVTAICGMYLLGSRNPAGFMCYALSSLAMLALAVLIRSPPIFVANALALVVTLHALWRWRSANADATRRPEVGGTGQDTP